MGKNESIFILNHEVKTALNGIIGYTQMLLKTPLNTEQKTYLENINTYSVKLLHNINNILDYHRLLTGNIIINIESVNILNVVNEINRLLNNNSRKTKISYNIESVIPDVKLDRNKLIQLILNLILSFLELDCTYINIRILNKDEKSLGFEIISDVKENNLSFGDILRNEFDNIKNKVYEDNVNIDLCICKMITLYLNWNLSFKFTENQRIYYINIPITDYNDKIDIKVLIADDNINNVNLLKDILIENIDISNIDVVYDGKNAISKLDNNHYDLLFLDMNMPIMDGRVVLQHIDMNNIDVNTYVISAWDYSEFLEKHNYGIKQYISKPYNIEQIKNIIMKYINK